MTHSLQSRFLPQALHQARQRVQGAIQACLQERDLFCDQVPAGQARVFRCLVQSLGNPDFGSNCRTVIVQKLQRRQDNWKFDVNLRRACEVDAQKLCSDVDHDSDKAETMRCMMSKYDELDEDCLHEVRTNSPAVAAAAATTSAAAAAAVGCCCVCVWICDDARCPVAAQVIRQHTNV
jgi:hypothetical protein